MYEPLKVRVELVAVRLKSELPSATPLIVEFASCALGRAEIPRVPLVRVMYEGSVTDAFCLDPFEYRSEFAVSELSIKPPTVAVPVTASVEVAVIAPPKNAVPEVYELPCTASEAPGVVVPTPTLPRKYAWLLLPLSSNIELPDTPPIAKPSFEPVPVVKSIEFDTSE